MPEELWTEVHDIEQEAVIKTIPKKNKCKKAKCQSRTHKGQHWTWSVTSESVIRMMEVDDGGPG